MKPFTRDVLERLSEELAAAGLKRLRRGKAAREVSPGVFAAVELQKRDWSDGAVSITAFAQAVHVAAAKLVATGHGGKFRLSEDMTVTRQVPHSLLQFVPEEDPAPGIERFRTLLADSILPMSMSFADPEAMLAFHEGELGRGGGQRPDIVLALRLALEPQADPDALFADVYGRICGDTWRSNLKTFWERLRPSLT